MTTPREDYEEALRIEWKDLAEPGTWWTGPERVSIGAEARMAARGLPPSGALPPAATEAARMVATDAASITPDRIAEWARAGLDEFAYVEVVGVVARVVAFDVAAFGLGRAEEPLPAGRPGEPSRMIPDDAERNNAWVATVGPAWAPSSLSAVTAESDAMSRVHGPLYMTLEQMGDMGIVRNDLSRPQIELVAARTSRINECFY